MEVFITKRNLHRIIKRVDSSKILITELYDKKIDFLSQSEIIELLKFKTVLSKNDGIEIYKHIEEEVEGENEKDLVLAYNNVAPTYHSFPKCDRLNSDFLNYIIPKSISRNAKKKAENRAMNEIETKKLIRDYKSSFKTWFKENLYLLEENETSFVIKMQSKFMISDGVEEFRRINTGVSKFSNFNLSELKISIDLHIRKANEFLRRYHNRGIIYLFNSISNNKELDGSNNTNLSNKELEVFYNQYDLQFKKPIKELLKQYYMVKFNPELSYDGNLLDQLGFRPCSSCRNTVVSEQVA